MLTRGGFDEALTESVSLPHGRGSDRVDAICNLPSALLNGKASRRLLHYALGAARTGGGTTGNTFGDLPAAPRLTAFAASRLDRPMTVCPEIDPAAPLQFFINAAAGSSDAETKREVIETALQLAGRRGELRFSRPAELARVAQEAAAQAIATCTAIVAVGGDGTLNTVAQAAHAVGCAMGVVPRGTFNYFARIHGIPADTTEAVRLLLRSAPAPVQVAGINDRVFLVNASLGLYPDLLEDREACKAHFLPAVHIALLLTSDGHVCSTEFDILKQLGAERELGLEPHLLPHIVHTLCEELLLGG